MINTTERLSADELLKILALSDIATAVYTTEDIRIETANDAMIAAWKKDHTVIGKTIEEALPELKGQPFFEILKTVWRTGISYEAKNVAADILTNGNMQRYFFNFEYRAVKKADGSMYCILHTSRDVTDEVDKTEIIKANEAEMVKLNKDLLRANRDLAESNRELNSMNENLFAAQKDMSIMYARLSASEEKFRTVIEQIPIATNVLRSRDLVIEIVNDRFLEIWGKNVTADDVVGRRLTEVNPEFIGQPFMQRLDEVYTTGVTYFSNSEIATVTRNGQQELRYYDLIFQALKNEHGSTYGILQVARDVTPEVMSTRHIQELNEELASINEELAAGNEELRSVNEEMLMIQDNLLKANAQLIESEERFRNMAEGTNMFIGVSDETGGATYFNNIWSETTGISNQDLIAYGWTDLLHPEDVGHAISVYKEAIAKKAPFTNEFRILNKDGNYIWLLLQGIPRRHQDGSFAGHIGSALDITERKRDDQRKSDFIGMVSHELKTPLTSLNGYLEIVRMDLKSEGNAFGAGLLDKAARQVSKMTTMINGFLNISRLESGKIQIEKTRFDMAALVEEIKDETFSMFNNHTIIFHPVEETFVNADWDKIGHVINNFISNAVKYSPYKTTINIACITVNGSAQVSVKDEGMGIGEEDIEKLFERYYRVDNKTVRAVAGFGIGLYLCAEIIHRNDGKIWVESELGKGSTFYFSLPTVD